MNIWKAQIEEIKNKFGDQEVHVPLMDSADIPIIYFKKEIILDLFSFLKYNLGYSYLSDITAVDNLNLDPCRFQVVYQLYSPTGYSRLRFKTKVNEGEEVMTLTSLWEAANWAEREVWDMFGIKFKAHPDLRRILMDSRWEGHPLRKDYPVRGYQIFPTSMPPDPTLLGVSPDQKVLEYANDLWTDSTTIVNIGPTHPAMHGALRMVARINGETIEKSYCEFGYTHRAKEKLGENRTYHQFIVYTDRLNYCSSLINNTAYALAVEKLLALDVPPRCKWIRMMCTEISRIIDHLVCVGINAVDLGAFSYFLYGYHQREDAYTLIEKLCGARLTTSYTRIGGLMADAPDGWEKEVKKWINKTRDVVNEMDRLLTTNKIWCNRTKGIAVFDKAMCMKYSYSGPNARAAGIDWDLRRDQPCLFYKDVEFDVPVCQEGDIYSRYLVRLEEIKQSLNILSQCADKISKGPIWVEDKRIKIPDKQEVYNAMEGLIHHFKFFMTGFDVPAGEAYTTFEAANGELGFYIVSRGGPQAYRMRIRSPSVYHYQGLSPMVEGEKIPDLVGALGSINIIAGELDR
ncbi:MAG: NADH-quinone oxidoreductase subunit D [Bdellovibrio sp.]|nr:NADH-quinone oxidoreductase subunit D [Bdellovibrio sp.]